MGMGSRVEKQGATRGDRVVVEEEQVDSWTSDRLTHGEATGGQGS